ncbi:MAG: M48 family metalloprotease [Rhodospirillaceae bacterium]
MRGLWNDLVKAGSLVDACTGAAGTMRSLVVAVLVPVLTLLPAATAGAQGRETKLEFIRDAEIEYIIRTYARPIFDAAGIDEDAVEIVLVKDQAINAFVAGGMNLFLNTGLLTECENPEQLIGVIAHETGHIAGGHLIRGHDAMEEASYEAILAMIVGAGVAIASGKAGAAAAVITGGQGLAQRNLLAFSRAQEASADAAAISFLDRAHITPRGFRDFMKKLAGQESLPLDRQAAYTRTHPLSRDRIDIADNALLNSRWKDAPMSSESIELFARLKGKLLGFIRPTLALHRYQQDDPSIAARYARAVALYQLGDLKTALPMIDALIDREPNNPFFYELKGQVLLENRRITDSLAPYRRSVALLPESGLLRGALAQALLETNNPQFIEEALKHLQVATAKERGVAHLWRLVATGWGRKNNDGMVAYALAEEALARGDRSMARGQCVRAEHLLPVGSPGWLRIQDIRRVVDTK